MNIQTQREIHFFIMFMLIGFTIHHIYSAWLVSREKKNGTLDSIFSGYKYITEAELSETDASRQVVPNTVPVLVEPTDSAVIVSESDDD